MGSKVCLVAIGLIAVFLCRGNALEVGEICANSGECITNAACLYDGSNSAITRCLCKFGYVLIDDAGTQICARIIHSDIDVNCEDCEVNGGTCYDQDLDDLKDGCLCASFVTGVDCSKTHVNVSCDVDTFAMVVCYEPQAAYNFSDRAVMIADAMAGDMACVAVEASAKLDCPDGNYRLVLPLTEAKRDRCGTKEFAADITTTKYENIILVQHSPAEMNFDDVSFSASCSFDTHANGVFEPIGLAVAARDGRGDYHKASLNFYVETQLGNAVPEGVALRLGDKIRFKIVLTADGTYAAIRVLRCIASTRPTTPDPNAVTLPLILGSCPSPDQTHITDVNNWQQISAQPNELKTGLVRMFKMSEGRSVHIHCAVKLCLKGSETECGSVACTSPNAHSSYGRKKRRASSDPTSVTVSRELTWFDAESETDAKYNSKSKLDQSALDASSPTTYVILLAALGSAFFIVIMGLVVIRLRMTGTTHPAAKSSYKAYIDDIRPTKQPNEAT